FRIGPDRAVIKMLEELTTEGAFVSINHPAALDDESCMGCGWSTNASEIMRRISGVEIVNGDVVEGQFAGWPMWARMRNSGLHLTAIGGSDDHSPDDTTDRAIGRPATVVYARELSEPALLEGLTRGLAYVRTRGPGGPTIEFDAFFGKR